MLPVELWQDERGAVFFTCTYSTVADALAAAMDAREILNYTEWNKVVTPPGEADKIIEFCDEMEANKRFLFS